MTAQQPRTPPKGGAAREAATGLAGRLAVSQTTTVAPARLKMPNVLWLERNEAQGLLERRLHRLARVAGNEGVVVAQDPPPDADVPLEGVVVIVLGVPKLSLTASNLNPRTDEQVTFTLAFDPPPASSSKVEYHFVWDDGADVTTAEPRTSRQFLEARTHSVSAYAVINGHWKTDRATMRISVAALPPATLSPVTVPQLLWLERKEADALLAPLKLSANVAGQEGIVVAQSVLPGSTVSPGSVLTITLGLPNLTLSTAGVNPRANDEVAFNFTFDPPPPAPPRVTYRIQWPDGTGETSADQPAMTHRFSLAGNYVVSGAALINGRFPVESNPVSLSVGEPATKMPQLLWLERGEAGARLRGLNVRAKIAGRDGIVIQQNPAAGSDVQPGSLITLTLGVPILSLSTSTATPHVNDEVTFNAAFDPPPSAPARIAYRFQWRDRTGETSGDQGVAAHRFSAAAKYVVSASAVINDRWTVDSTPLVVSVAPPPPTIPWRVILLVAAALIVAALLFRVLNRKAVRPSPQPPAVSVRSGLGSTSHTIQHPEQIRNGLSVRLRAGFRSAVAPEGGADA